MNRKSARMIAMVAVSTLISFSASSQLVLFDYDTLVPGSGARENFLTGSSSPFYEDASFTGTYTIGTAPGHKNNSLEVYVQDIAAISSWKLLLYQAPAGAEGNPVSIASYDQLYVWHKTDNAASVCYSLEASFVNGAQTGVTALYEYHNPADTDDDHCGIWYHADYNTAGANISTTWAKRTFPLGQFFYYTQTGWPDQCLGLSPMAGFETIRFALPGCGWNATAGPETFMLDDVTLASGTVVNDWSLY